MPTDWFRDSSWDPASQANFERRLARARSNSRPQYIRIKGLALAEAGDLSAARALFERVIRDYPNSLDCRASLEHLGDLARRQVDHTTAQRAYQELFERWPDLNATSGMVEVSLAELLLEERNQGRAQEALRLLQSAIERRGAVDFNANLFRWHIALIRAAEAVGDPETVKRAATTALRLAERGPRLPASSRTQEVKPRLVDAYAPSPSPPSNRSQRQRVAGHAPCATDQPADPRALWVVTQASNSACRSIEAELEMVGHGGLEPPTSAGNRP